MRFICDVCPATASRGESVIIGHYEKWVRHLLSPQHQLEQNLAMTRTSYWPDADWVAILKGLPAYDETSAELFEDMMMKLSEYGFIEAVYYGNKINSVCIALQLYETSPVPSYLRSPDGTKYEIKISPRVQSNLMKGSNASKIEKRSVRFLSTPSSMSEEEASKKLVNVATSPIPRGFLVDHSSETDRCNIKEDVENIKHAENGLKKPRIRYDRQTLLQFRDETFMPPRFTEILTFPRYLIEDKAKCVDPTQMQKVQWVVDENVSSVNHAINGFNGKSSRAPFSKDHWNQTGWKNNGNHNTQWRKIVQTPNAAENDEEDW